jgi:hypothetical protein
MKIHGENRVYRGISTEIPLSNLQKLAIYVFFSFPNSHRISIFTYTEGEICFATAIIPIMVHEFFLAKLNLRSGKP